MNMFLKSSFLVFVIATFFLASSVGYAGLNPKGWGKGKKKGWSGENVPPGVSKKEMKEKENQAKKEAKKAEREIKKKTREARKAAKETHQEAGKATQL